METVEIASVKPSFPSTEHDHCPFRKVHERPRILKVWEKDVYIETQPINVHLTEVEQRGRFMKKNIYIVRLDHGRFRWTIYRSFGQFKSLHEHLQGFKLTFNVPTPGKDDPNKPTGLTKLPRIPKKPDFLIGEEGIENRKHKLETYLQTLINDPIYRNHPSVLEFIEVSHLSFIGELGSKGKEELLKKCSRRIKIPCLCCGGKDAHYCDLVSQWHDRWLVLKDTFVAYIRPKDNRVRSVLLFDQDFKIRVGKKETGYKNSLLLCSSTQDLLLKFNKKRQVLKWKEDILNMAQTKAKVFIEPTRFNSYAPVRSETKARWFIDGSSYFEAVADALELAEEEIFITDWWLSPEIYLKRPINDGEKWRLDRILERKANEGVRIFVLLYKEVELALGINSYYSKHTLIKRNSENIKVLRDPDHTPKDVFLWTHHEKLVIVDQKIAFIGGIDLCFGRWDDHIHRLTDLGTDPVNQDAALSKTCLDGARLMVHLTTSIDKDVTPDTAPPSDDPTAKDQSSIPVSRPGENVKANTPPMKKKTKKVINLMKVKKGQKSQIPEIPSPTEFPTEYDLDRLGIKSSSKLWLGKDYANFIYKDFAQVDNPYIDLIDRTVMPRMPWHDIAAAVYGKAARDLARHFIQRWNYTKRKKAKHLDEYIYLLPKSYKYMDLDPAITENATSATCQIVRSLDYWSGGNKHNEDSIQQAYISAIQNSEYFIYIENQFFITAHAGSSNVLNGLGEALYQRIVRAHERQEVFRIYVVMPLLPGIEGEIGTEGGAAIQLVNHWNYQSICRGGNSLYERLRARGVDPLIYLRFFGLRTYAELDEKPVTELIYVHSKLMIVDDKLAIIGSANINDRSMLGKRDSEMAVVIEDQETENSLMNGQEYQAGKLVGSLRRTLFREHLGFWDREGVRKVVDPVIDSFYNDIWIQIADRNTSIYEEVFSCIPSDEVNNFADLQTYQMKVPLSETDPDLAREKIRNIRGHLVNLPLEFLCNEDLTPALTTKEGIMPSYFWT